MLEGVKDRRQLLRCDTDAGIADLEAQLRFRRLRLGGAFLRVSRQAASDGRDGNDHLALRRELDRVPHEVDDHLP